MDDFCIVDKVEDNDTVFIVSVVAGVLLVVMVIGIVLIMVVKKFVVGKFSVSSPQTAVCSFHFEVSFIKTFCFFMIFSNTYSVKKSRKVAICFPILINTTVFKNLNI